MAFYTYQATDGAGNPVRGTLQAKDERDLVEKLRAMGLLPIEVSEGAVRTPNGSSPWLGTGRVTAGDVAGFTRELSGMIEAGFPLDRALGVLSSLERKGPFREVLREIQRDIKGGSSFAESLEKHPKVFPEVYRGTVRAGEAGGALDTVLSRLAAYLEESRRMREDLVSALIYPALLTAAGGGAIAVMLGFVVPRFSALFGESGSVMPLPTRLLLAISEAVSAYWTAAAVVALISGVAAWRVLRDGAGRAFLDGLRLKLPLIGGIALKSSVSRFSRTLGILLQGGLPILDALRIAVGVIGNRSLSSEMAPVIDGVRRGRGLSAPIGEVEIFPRLAVHMLSVGEETGRLDEALLRLADKYDNEVRTFVKRLLGLIEPAIILAMAVVVGFIVISLLMAVFSLNDITF